MPKMNLPTPELMSDGPSTTDLFLPVPFPEVDHLLEDLTMTGNPSLIPCLAQAGGLLVHPGKDISCSMVATVVSVALLLFLWGMGRVVDCPPRFLVPVVPLPQDGLQVIMTKPMPIDPPLPMLDHGAKLVTPSLPIYYT